MHQIYGENSGKSIELEQIADDLAVLSQNPDAVRDAIVFIFRKARESFLNITTESFINGNSDNPETPIGLLPMKVASWMPNSTMMVQSKNDAVLVVNVGDDEGE